MFFGVLRGTRAAIGTKLSHFQSKLAVGECTQFAYGLACQVNHHSSSKQWRTRYNLTSAAAADWRGRRRRANHGSSWVLGYSWGIAAHSPVSRGTGDCCVARSNQEPRKVPCRCRFAPLRRLGCACISHTTVSTSYNKPLGIRVWIGVE